MRNYQKHPNLFLGIITFILLIFSVGLKANRHNEVGDIVLISTFVLGAIHWIWSIIDVARTDTLDGSQKVVWLIAVIAIPLGGMLYYILHSKRNTIVD